MLCSIPLPVGCPVVSVSDYRHRPRVWEISSAACVGVAMASLGTDKPSWQLPSTKYDFSTMLTDVARIGVMVTVASKLASTSLDAHVVFDEMAQSWNFIFTEYAAAAGHHHRSLVWQVAEDYSHYDFLLQLPIYCPMPTFRDVIDVPLVVRRWHMFRSSVRKELGIADDVKVVIFNFEEQPMRWEQKKIWLRDGWLCLGLQDTAGERHCFLFKQPPWPPPMQFVILADGVQVRPIPWPPQLVIISGLCNANLKRTVLE
jgi:hypothetical protein